MNEDERGDQLPVSEADTTPPNPANPIAIPAGQGWQMPEPKFQQTSGYLPEGYLDKVAAFEASAPAEPPIAATPEPMPQAPAAAADVEPQPDLTEQLVEHAAPVVAKPAVKERSAGARIAMILLGLLAMAAFIAVFLGVIYYLFLAPPNGGSTF